MVHGLRSQFAFAIGAADPQGSQLREVDVFLAGIWLTCEDDQALVTGFAYSLELTIDWILSNRVPESPYPDLAPDELHRRLAAESDGWDTHNRFMDWGPTTDNFRSFIHRRDESVHITASFHEGRNHPRPAELGRVFHAELPERQLLLILHRTACDLRYGASPLTVSAASDNLPTASSLAISLPIACPYPRALAFLSDPHAFPQWASGLTASPLTPTADPHTFCAQTPASPARIRFTPPNPFGVLDHYVHPENAPAELHIPMRLLPNNDACEITLTLRRLPDMTDAQFAADADWVRRDLVALKSLLEQT